MPGNIGEKGMQGDVGIQGFKGNKGSVGWFGIKGQKGHIGSRGSKGEKGLKGKQGLKGNKGKAGHVFSGDIGNKGFKGYIGDRGYDGFLIAVQGSKNNDHKYARSIEVIHNHQHHHSHSHEHNQKYGAHYNYTHHGTHYNHAEAVSRSSNDSDVVGSAAEQREGLTQHLLLDDEDLRIIEGFTSQELTEFIDAQLKLSGNGRGMKRIARSTQERESNNIPGNFNKFIHQSSYYLTPLSNFSEDVAVRNVVPNKFNEFNESRPGVSYISKSFNGNSSTNRQISQTSMLSDATNVNKQTNSVKDTARMKGDTEVLQEVTENQNQFPKFKNSMELSPEKNINLATPKYYVSDSTRAVDIERNRDKTAISLHFTSVRNEKLVSIIGGNFNGQTRRRRSKGEEIISLPAEVYKHTKKTNPSLTFGIGIHEEVLDAVNDLWRKYNTKGCLRCSLFSFLLEQPTINLDSLIVAGFAHVLGDSGSLQLLDDVRRGRQRGVKMSCVKTGSSCSLEIQN
ncbi:uncharacterized protein LOC108673901 [Hyalella azteca]|uniref:Uncharacterized protein LOC108673901 n=1 Tax=Hyalella azteca TaxID=294128 RepID=A0A8B7NU76_HYAAZ|nr:uncharacterized protein LOC108673901 [Hyalella azteca]